MIPEADLQVRVPREGGDLGSLGKDVREARSWPPPAFAGDAVKTAKEKNLKDKPAKSAASLYAPLPDALPLCVLVAT